MQFLQSINDMLTEQLGPFGPLIVVGVLGLFMILVTIPIMMNQPEDPLKKLKRDMNPKTANKPKKEQLRQGGRNEQLEKFAGFLEPKDADELSAMQLKLRQAGYQSQDADGYSKPWNRTSVGANFFLAKHDIKFQVTYQMGENKDGETGNDVDELFVQVQYVF
jgi:hypothetical protein